MNSPHRLIVYVAGSLVALALVGGLAAHWYKTTQPEYRLRHGREALHQGDLPTARRMALLLESGGHRDEAHLLGGEILVQQRRFESALEEFNRIKDQGAIRLEAIALSGRCLLNLKSLREAERAFSFVLHERPDDVDAHRGLASLYYDQGALREAVRHLLEVARLDPADGRPYRLLGLIYKDQDDYAQAVPCYREALQRQLKAAVVQEVLVELAECLIKQSEFQPALDTLERCSPESAANAPVLVLRAECLRGLSRGDEARALLDQVLATKPTAPALRLRAQLHLDAGAAREAAGLLENALQLDAADFHSRYQLALAYEKLGRQAEAAEQRRRWQQTQADLAELSKLSQAAQNNPWDANARRRLAELCEKLDKPELARLWQAAAAACPPPNRPAPPGP